MIIEFDNSCWSSTNDDWKRSLIELLMLTKRHAAHSVIAVPSQMLPWCEANLPLFADYFKTRLSAAQPRTKALRISISPIGASSPAGDPPWTLTADAAAVVVGRPLRLVLENDESDRRFLESTVPSISEWCSRGWVETTMGGGAAMGTKIQSACVDVVTRWRTFFLFDSDRLHPAEFASGWAPPRGDSCQGHVFELLCNGVPQERWHRLERRSIENYLPASVLQSCSAGLTATLFGTSVGQMLHFYNMKKGLRGDGVSPVDPNKTARALRSQGFWASLPSAEVTTLEPGFGREIANEFANLPVHHPWPAAVVTEMTGLADALQDAM